MLADTMIDSIERAYDRVVGMGFAENSAEEICAIRSYIATTVRNSVAKCIVSASKWLRHYPEHCRR